MKKMLSFAIAVITVIAAITPTLAQSGEPVDSSYFLKQGNQFFEVKTSIYPDGSEKTIKLPIGDTLALVQSAKDRLTSNAAAMAVDIRYVSTFRRRFADLLREADEVKALTGIDPQKGVQDEYVAPFIISGWTIKRDGSANDVSFSVNGQGQMKFTIGAAGAKNALLIGNALRLKNYPSNGTDTDLFALPNGVWVNSDRSVVLRPPGNNAPVNRSVAPVKSKKG